MSGDIYIEERIRSLTISLSWDIAHHLYARATNGKTFIVTEDPAPLLAAVSKQWHQIIRQVQRERSSTLDATRILALTGKVVNMQRLRFTTKAQSEEPEGDVFFATSNELMPNPPRCHTMYLTYLLSESCYKTLTSRVAWHGLIVMYC
jgi:hypothetical protein